MLTIKTLKDILSSSTCYSLMTDELILHATCAGESTVNAYVYHSAQGGRVEFRCIDIDTPVFLSEDDNFSVHVFHESPCPRCENYWEVSVRTKETQFVEIRARIKPAHSNIKDAVQYRISYNASYFSDYGLERLAQQIEYTKNIVTHFAIVLINKNITELKKD